MDLAALILHRSQFLSSTCVYRICFVALTLEFDGFFLDTANSFWADQTLICKLNTLNARQLEV